MKKSELRQMIKEEMASMEPLSDYDALKLLMDIWEKIPLGVRQHPITRDIALEIRERLNKKGYKLVKI